MKFDPTRVSKVLGGRGFQGRTAAAVFQILTTGQTPADAAREYKVSPAAVSRMLTKLSIVKKCPTCGHVTKEIKL